ncbi:hypothetical protein DES49_2149 [Halospina denitrificans]|uniref:TPR repeat protein n=1 Tax=Halospina denitrificans TaxID=332522 RepID=A0A4R7JSV5_9GAMM|nr:tetratricopeptide repeat protein [Halospina denitrificans]TDT40383.1 hypothetical protein DES49_2149 [Halospina denitrificans]
MRKTSLIIATLLLTACAAPTLKEANQAREAGNPKEAAEIYGRLASAGSAQAKLQLYKLYQETGIGLDSDRAARDTLELVANEDGLPEAQYRLGRILREEREFEAAESQLEKAADAGYQPAVEYLDTHGELLRREVRVARSSPDRQKHLGDDLYQGRNGLEKDAARAAYWYERSAERGHPGAQTMLGYLYYQGDGVEQDYGRAFEWYKEAALQGHAGSQASLGYLYGEGRGVERNLKQAYAWSTLAAENGSDRGSKNQQIYLDAMDNDERLESLNAIRRIEKMIHGGN